MTLPAQPSGRFVAALVACAAALALLPGPARAESLHVVFPQTAEVTVVQGESTDFTLEVQAFGATPCDATTAPVIIDTLYSVDSAGDIAAGVPADMPIQTDTTRGDSGNCYIQTPVEVPLTATAAPDTPVGDYTSVIRYGKGGDGDIDLDGPELIVHVIAPAQQPATLPPVQLTPPEIIVLGEREAPRPVLGKSVELTLVKGRVAYREPGKGARLLAASVIVPNGTVVDTTRGVVKVTVARDKTGALDSADAWDGGFVVNQTLPKGARPLTIFTLTGAVTISRRSASAARVQRSARKRSLWVNAKGNFKTRGKRASAIVRGTYWHTEETGAGTKVTVKRGLVAVRDFVRKRTILVPRGHSYTAPNRVPPIRRPVFTGSA